MSAHTASTRSVLRILINLLAVAACLSAAPEASAPISRGTAGQKEPASQTEGRQQITLADNGKPIADAEVALVLANMNKISLGRTDSQGKSTSPLDLANATGSPAQTNEALKKTALGKLELHAEVDECPDGTRRVYLVGDGAQLQPPEKGCKRRRLAGTFFWGASESVLLDTALGTLVAHGGPVTSLATKPAPASARTATVPAGGAPLPDEATRAIDRAMDQYLGGKATNIRGDVDPAGIKRGLPDKQAIVLVEDVYTRDLTNYAKKMADLASLPDAELDKLTHQLRIDASAVYDTYALLQTATNAFNPLDPEHTASTEKARYEGLIRDAAWEEQHGNGPRAAMLRQFAADSRWQHFITARDNFYAALDKNPLLGIQIKGTFTDGDYLFKILQTVIDYQTKDSELRQMIRDHLNASREQTIEEINRIANMEDFTKLWELGSPRYQRQQEQAAALGPYAKQLIDSLVATHAASKESEAVDLGWKNLGITVLVAGTSLIPVVGPAVSAGIQLYHDGSDLVIAYVDNLNVENASGAIGYTQRINSAEALADARFRTLVAAAMFLPTVPGAVSDLRAAHIKIVRRATAATEARLAEEAALAAKAKTAVTGWEASREASPLVSDFARDAASGVPAQQLRDKAMALKANPQAMRSLKEAPAEVRDAFNAAEAQVYKQHDQSVIDYVRTIEKDHQGNPTPWSQPEYEVRVDDFRTPGSAGGVNTDRDFRVLYKVRGEGGDWIEVPKEYWQSYSTKQFAEASGFSPEKVRALASPEDVAAWDAWNASNHGGETVEQAMEEKWKELHQQLGTDKYHPEASVEFSDQGVRTSREAQVAQNIKDVKQGKALLKDPQGFGMMYHEKADAYLRLRSALHPAGDKLEAMAQLNKGIDMLSEVRSGYEEYFAGFGQKSGIPPVSTRFEEASKAIKSLGPFNATITEAQIKAVEEKLASLGYGGQTGANPISGFVNDLDGQFEALKLVEAPRAVESTAVKASKAVSPAIGTGAAANTANNSVKDPVPAPAAAPTPAPKATPAPKPAPTETPSSCASNDLYCVAPAACNDSSCMNVTDLCKSPNALCSNDTRVDSPFQIMITTAPINSTHGPVAMRTGGRVVYTSYSIPLPRITALPAGLTTTDTDQRNKNNLDVSLVSTGDSSGQAFQLQVRDPSGKTRKVALAEGTVLVPTKRGEKPTSARGPADALTEQINGFCLQFSKQPPAAGMEYKIASPEMQQNYAPIKEVLQAGRALAEDGRLHPDSEPVAYADSIRQYAVWSKVEGWNEQKFGDEFVDRTKKNAEAKKVKWTPAIEQAVRKAVPGRWADVSQVLSLAESWHNAAALQPHQ